MNNNLLKRHAKDFQKNRKRLRAFITRNEDKMSEKDVPLVAEAEKAAWQKINCLDCANCCKTMSPTYTKADIDRISAHLGMTPAEFKKKWLYYDRENRDWMNKSTPCQFLDLKTNMCTIYAVRPDDCAGFPHFMKRPFKDYFYIHKQNIEYCPATMEMIKKLEELKKEQKKT